MVKRFSKRAAVTVQFQTPLRLSQAVLREFVEKALVEAAKKESAEVLHNIRDIRCISVFPDFDDRLKGLLHHD